jgi:large subunit ribosomal protein L6
MSRIGKHPIEVLSGVKVLLEGDLIEVSGPNGALKHKIHSDVEVKIDGAWVSVNPKYNTKRSRSLWGTVRQVINNMAIGVKDGYKRVLDISGVGFKASVKGDILTLFLGYSHNIMYIAPHGISFLCPKPTQIEVHGYDKRLVGQVAAEIRSFRKPEPFKGKGIRYDNEVVRRKEGKKK